MLTNNGISTINNNNFDGDICGYNGAIHDKSANDTKCLLSKCETLSVKPSKSIVVLNIDNKNAHMSSSIYRYKFTTEFMEELYEFSKIHQYDDRHDFKEAWDNWIKENDEQINKEIMRLLYLGYEGNVMEKMFKSARYYFRKKSTEKKEPKKRKNYISMNRSILSLMDEHIKQNQNKQPKESLEQFIMLYKNEIDQLLGESCDYETKIKKTYKNRYFMLFNNKNINTKLNIIHNPQIHKE